MDCATIIKNAEVLSQKVERHDGLMRVMIEALEHERKELKTARDGLNAIIADFSKTDEQDGIDRNGAQDNSDNANGVQNDDDYHKNDDNHQNDGNHQNDEQDDDSYCHENDDEESEYSDWSELDAYDELSSEYVEGDNTLLSMLVFPLEETEQC